MAQATSPSPRCPDIAHPHPRGLCGACSTARLFWHWHRILRLSPVGLAPPDGALPEGRDQVGPLQTHGTWQYLYAEGSRGAEPLLPLFPLPAFLLASGFTERLILYRFLVTCFFLLTTGCGYGSVAGLPRLPYPLAAVDGENTRPGGKGWPQRALCKVSLRTAERARVSPTRLSQSAGLGRSRCAHRWLCASRGGKSSRPRGEAQPGLPSSVNAQALGLLNGPESSCPPRHFPVCIIILPFLGSALEGPAAAEFGIKALKREACSRRGSFKALGLPEAFWPQPRPVALLREAGFVRSPRLWTTPPPLALRALRPPPPGAPPELPPCRAESALPPRRRPTRRPSARPRRRGPTGKDQTHEPVSPRTWRFPSVETPQPRSRRSLQPEAARLHLARWGPGVRVLAPERRVPRSSSRGAADQSWPVCESHLERLRSRTRRRLGCYFPLTTSLLSRRQVSSYPGLFSYLPNAYAVTWAGAVLAGGEDRWVSEGPRPGARPGPEMRSAGFPPLSGRPPGCCLGCTFIPVCTQHALLDSMPQADSWAPPWGLRDSGIRQWHPAQESILSFSCWASGGQAYLDEKQQLLGGARPHLGGGGSTPHHRAWNLLGPHFFSIKSPTFLFP
uniref:uncharacterized protein LOC128932360 n=1 Tax=Callithrix jacchus TaxID=9483 RepID=UPI0023DD2614|nr:uncharacterized protein LOC128932360 [Callithrix jacchus]